MYNPVYYLPYHHRLRTGDREIEQTLETRELIAFSPAAILKLALLCTKGQHQAHISPPLFQSPKDRPQSSSNVQIQYLRHEITSKTLALQDLQRDYDRLLTNVLPQQQQQQTPPNIQYPSDPPPLLADKANLEKQVSELQTQINELLQAQEEAQRESTASRTQYMQIMAMSSRLQAQSTTDGRRWQAEKEEWEEQRQMLLDKIHRLEQQINDKEKEESNHNSVDNNNDSSLEIQALEQKCRSLERYIQGLKDDARQLDETLQTTLRLSANLRARVEQAG